MASVVHPVWIGGVGKDELLRSLRSRGVELNPAALELLADRRFSTLATPRCLEVLELAVEDLGLPRGGTMPAIRQAALSSGLAPCPLEVGPHLRLQLLGQEEGQIGFPRTRHCAPPGSITVVSIPIATDDQTPKGFYLRRIDGSLWLRGYRSDDQHVWAGTDRLAFCRADPAV